MSDPSWLYDVRWSPRVGATYAFDDKALEVDEGYRRLLDEVRHSAEAKLRALEEAIISADETRVRLQDIKFEYQARVGPIARQYGQFLALYARPFVIGPPGMISGIG